MRFRYEFNKKTGKLFGISQFGREEIKRIAGVDPVETQADMDADLAAARRHCAVRGFVQERTMNDDLVIFLRHEPRGGTKPSAERAIALCLAERSRTLSRQTSKGLAMIRTSDSIASAEALVLLAKGVKL